MSEYWVSKKKYFCKYCDTYIADDAPSRQQHENGMRHKGNTERFIRSLYKGSENRKKELDEERRDMARVEQAAQAAFAQDVASGHAKPSSAPVASTSTTSRKPQPKPSNPYANYSTAESLGYQDPDAEWNAAEAERRRTQGVAGAWEIITPPLSVSTLTTEGAEDGAGDTTLKRGAEVLIDEEDSRQFKLRKKTLSLGLGEVYDPGMIPIKPKKTEKLDTAPELSLSTTPGPTDTPKWTKVQWKRPGDIKEKESDVSPNHIDTEAITIEDSIKPDPLAPVSDLASSAASESPPQAPVAKIEEMKPEPLGAAPGGAVFRKRKIPASGSRGKR